MNSFSLRNLNPKLTVALGTILAFFASCDQVFTLRIGFGNIRFTQIFIALFFAYTVLFQFKESFKLVQDFVQKNKWLVISWLIFLAATLVSSFRGESLLKTNIKSIWATANLFGCIYIFLHFNSKQIWKGVLLGCLITAAIVYVDAFWVYAFQSSTPLIGQAQNSYPYLGRIMLRPHGFFYEPSYASSMLALSGLLFLFKPALKNIKLNSWCVGLLFAASILTSSRSGIVFIFFSILLLVPVYFAALRNSNLKSYTPHRIALGACLIFILLFSVNTENRKYLSFMSGPLGIKGSIYRIKRHFIQEKQDSREISIKNPYEKAQCQGNLKSECKDWSNNITKKFDMSEGSRLRSMIRSLETMIANGIVFGKGVSVDKSGGIIMMSTTMWLELGIESGLLAALAFGITLFFIFRMQMPSNRWYYAFIPMIGFCVILMNLTINYPRLDYWLMIVSFSLLPFPKKH